MLAYQVLDGNLMSTHQPTDLLLGIPDLTEELCLLETETDSLILSRLADFSLSRIQAGQCLVQFGLDLDLDGIQLGLE